MKTNQVKTFEISGRPDLINNNDWIQYDDEELLRSVIKHEGGKSVIYVYMDRGTLKAADGCDFEYCKANNLWPAYIDTEGLDTVGIGHLITGKEAYNCYAGVDDDTVMKQLAEDLASHLQGAKKLANDSGMDKIGGNYVVQRFMTELCFNIGQRGYSKFKNGLKKLTSAVNGDGQFTYNQAADEHLDSKWSQQVKQRAKDMVDTLRALDKPQRELKMKNQNVTNKGQAYMLSEIEEMEDRTLAMIASLKEDCAHDGGWLAIGKTDIEKGFMALKRSICEG